MGRGGIPPQQALLAVTSELVERLGRGWVGEGSPLPIQVVFVVEEGECEETDLSVDEHSTDERRTRLVRNMFCARGEGGWEVCSRGACPERKTGQPREPSFRASWGDLIGDLMEIILQNKEFTLT